MVKPKLLSEREVRTQAIRVRSAAIKLRDVARSVRICASSFDYNFPLSVMSALLDACMRLRLFTVKRKANSDHVRASGIAHSGCDSNHRAACDPWDLGPGIVKRSNSAGAPAAPGPRKLSGSTAISAAARSRPAA